MTSDIFSTADQHTIMSRPATRYSATIALATSISLHALAIMYVAATINDNSFSNGSTRLVVQEIMLNSPPPTTEIRTGAPTPETVKQEPVAEQSAALNDSQEAEHAPSAPAPATELKQTLKSMPLGLGMMHGYFSSIADGKTLRSDIRDYYFEVVEKINQEWWKKSDQLTEQMLGDGFIELVILKDGSLGSVHLKQKTGSRQADEFLFLAIEAAAPLPPLPATFEKNTFSMPLRIKAPTSLFRNLQ